MVAITKTLCAVMAASSVAVASPTGKGNSPKGTGLQAQRACARQDKSVACLNRGGNFGLLNIPIVSLLLQITALCSTQTVACCDTDQEASASRLYALWRYLILIPFAGLGRHPEQLQPDPDSLDAAIVKSYSVCRAGEDGG